MMGNGFSISILGDPPDISCSSDKLKSGGCSWNDCDTCKDPSTYCGQSKENCSKCDDTATWCVISPCLKKLNSLCKGKSQTDCHICAGEHASELKKVECTNKDFDTFCKSSPSPSPSPSDNKAGHTSSEKWNKFTLPKTDVTSPEIKYLINKFADIKNTRSLINIMMTKQTEVYRNGINNIYPAEDIFKLQTLWTSLEKINRENIFDDNKFLTNIDGDNTYGLINLIAFISESGVETGYFTVCDEQWFKDSGDYSKNPSCGQWAPSGVGGYMGPNYTGGKHDCKKNTALNLEAVTWSPWAERDHGLIKCQADSGDTGPSGTGTEGCCFWGRGSIQLTGQKNVGNFNNAIKNTYPDVNVCENPNLLCLDPELRWLGGLHYWITVVQKDPNFIPQIKKYVSDGFVTDPNKLNIDLKDRCPQANPSTAGCSDANKNSNSFPAGCSAMVNMGNWNATAQDEEKRLKDFCSLIEHFFPQK